MVFLQLILVDGKLRSFDDFSSELLSENRRIRDYQIRAFHVGVPEPPAGER